MEFNRKDSVMHPTRGYFFDGRYDYISFSGALPPTFTMHFWVNTEHGGSLYSTNAVFDESDQNFVHVGIRGNRMEMGVSEGENFFASHNKGKNYGVDKNYLIPDTSIHASGKHFPRIYYSQTDMDVVKMNEW
jgi:hypothetical protein